MIRTFVWPALGAVLGMAVADPAFAHLPLRTQGTRPPIINVIDTAKKLDANQLSMFVTNIGSFAYDLGAQNSGLEFPKGTGKTCVYAAGLWMGAKVGSDVRVTVAEYSQEFAPGPMIGGGPAPGIARSACGSRSARRGVVASHTERPRRSPRRVPPASSWPG